MISHKEVEQLWGRSSEDIGVLAAHIAAILAHRHGSQQACETYNRILGQHQVDPPRVLHG